MKSLCVFCGSSMGARPEYREAAGHLARLLVRRSIRIVYGGASVGLMGELADTALAAGGEVIGVIPRQLVELEVAHRGAVDLRIVSSMHERKALMAELSDGFIALPGGIGTLEETFEALTWSQLGLQSKPIGFLDVCGYYATLAAFLDRAMEERFLRPEHRANAIFDSDAEGLLERMSCWIAPVTAKWIDR